MNRSLLIALIAVGALLFPVATLRSQQAKPTPEQVLKKLKEDNQKLLETQQATLEKLDGVLKDAQQLRGFAHRT